MCSRYFITDKKGTRRDVRPSDCAPVICLKNGVVSAARQRWGFTSEGGKLVINARAESALDKPMFSESLLKRRLVIPADGFYEWNSQREKHIFTAEKEKLYMAGFCRWEGEEWRFCILTTQANPSVKPVHARMPLILKENQVEEWLKNEERLREFLGQEPEPLKREAPYEQLSLF